MHYLKLISEVDGLLIFTFLFSILDIVIKYSPYSLLVPTLGAE